ncbi:MAG: B3/4 domain-containing protein, partial [Erysipelotrichaceae bacterium]|nr:B3/4 domain-containing protein [Erysipelotrichaceae bacterium]
VARGLDNHVTEEEKYLPLLQQGEQLCLKYLSNPEFSCNPVVAVWRDAFSRFKTKKGARSSIEALLKRVKNGNHLNSINPLVDIYNYISLKYALPCGGEDIDRFEGDIRLTKADGNEEFITYGSDESEPPYEGEICYKDDRGAICRCWNWREGVRTILTEDTINAFMIMELVDPARTDDLKAALEELAELMKKNLGAQTEIKVLDVSNRSVTID